MEHNNHYQHLRPYNITIIINIFISAASQSSSTSSSLQRHNHHQQLHRWHLFLLKIEREVVDPQTVMKINTNGDFPSTNESIHTQKEAETEINAKHPQAKVDISHTKKKQHYCEIVPIFSENCRRSWIERKLIKFNNTERRKICLHYDYASGQILQTLLFSQDIETEVGEVTDKKAIPHARTFVSAKEISRVVR